MSRNSTPHRPPPAELIEPDAVAWDAERGVYILRGAAPPAAPPSRAAAPPPTVWDLVAAAFAFGLIVAGVYGVATVLMGG